MGHKGVTRRLLAESEVDKIVECPPVETCDECESAVLITKVSRHQVYEIPEFNFDVTEYKKYKGCCSGCSKKFSGHYPEGVTSHCLGRRAQSLIGLLTTKFRLSKRLAVDFFKETFGLPISLGTISNTEAVVSQSLEPFYTAVEQSIKSAKTVHVDETGHKEKNKNGWAWIMSTAEATLFALRRSRGKKVAQALIGNYATRIFITDRYAAYNYLPDENRQVCWAHLKRDFRKISERKGKVGIIGTQLLKYYNKIFHLWKTEPLKRRLEHDKTRKWFRRFQGRILYLLQYGATCGHKQTQNTCQNLLDIWPALWTFWSSNVPPTNNQAERQLRPLVISKKLTFGTQSDRGSRYIERMFTAIMTSKQQNANLLQLVQKSLQQFFYPSATTCQL